MSDKKVEVKITGNDVDLRRKLDASTKKISAFGSAVHTTFSGITRTVDAANKTFGTFGKITAALGTGAVLKKLFSLNEFMKVDDALLMMQANLGMTAAELNGFKNEMSSMAGKAGEDMGELFRASSKLSKSFTPDEILKIMDASSMASHAMEQDLDSVTDRIVQIMKMYKKTPDEAMKIAQAMTASNASADTLNTFLERGIMKGGAGKGYQEILAIAGAMDKVGAKSPRVAVGVSSIISSIEDNQAVLKSAGIDVFRIDPTTGKKVKKDITQILEELKPALEKARKRFQDDAAFNKAMDETFGQNASDAIPFLISQIGAIKKAKENQANAAHIAGERAAKADEKWSEQLERIKGYLDKIKVDMSWIYDIAKKPFKFLAESPNLTKGLGYGAAGLSALVLGGMAYGKGREFLKNFKGTAAGIAQGKAIEAATGVTPVFVTNWPGGGSIGRGMGTRDIAFGGGAGLPGPAGGVGKFVRGLGWIPVFAGVAAASYEAGTALGEAGHGDWATSPLQTLNKAIFEGIFGKTKAGGTQNQINLTVNIDKNGRVKTDSDDMNTKIDLPRGNLGDD